MSGGVRRVSPSRLPARCSQLRPRSIRPSSNNAFLGPTAWHPLAPSRPSHRGPPSLRVQALFPPIAPPHLPFHIPPLKDTNAGLGRPPASAPRPGPQRARLRQGLAQSPAIWNAGLGGGRRGRDGGRAGSVDYVRGLSMAPPAWIDAPQASTTRGARLPVSACCACGKSIEVNHRAWHPPKQRDRLDRSTQLQMRRMGRLLVSELGPCRTTAFFGDCVRFVCPAAPIPTRPTPHHNLKHTQADDDILISVSAPPPSPRFQMDSTAATAISPPPLLSPATPLPLLALLVVAVVAAALLRSSHRPRPLRRIRTLLRGTRQADPRAPFHADGG